MNTKGVNAWTGVIGAVIVLSILGYDNAPDGVILDDCVTSAILFYHNTYCIVQICSCFPSATVFLFDSDCNKNVNVFLLCCLESLIIYLFPRDVKFVCLGFSYCFMCVPVLREI